MSRRHYGTFANDLHLNSGDVDPLKMDAISIKYGIESIVPPLTREKASWHNFKSGIDDMILLSDKEPDQLFFFFISIHSHGFQLKTGNFGGSDCQLECLCLYDRMVLEHEIREKLSDFGQNCKVFFMISGCFSKGVLVEHINYLVSLKDGKHEFLRRGKYKEKAKKYFGRTFKYKAEILSIASAKKDDRNIISDLNKSSPFVEAFLYILAIAGKTSNYATFFDQFKTSYKYQNDFRPQMVPEIIPENSFFKMRTPIENETINENYLMKKKIMSWTLNFAFDQSQPSRRLQAVVTHPQTMKLDSYIKLKPGEMHPFVKNEPILSGFRENDFIRILIFGNGESTGRTSQDLNAYESPQNGYCYTFVINSNSGNVETHEKSSEQLSSDIGSSGSLDE